MKIIEIKLLQIRGFEDSREVNLSKSINVFLGPNNSGKSTLIKSIYCLQNPAALVGTDVRANTNRGKVLFKVRNNGTSFGSNKGNAGVVNRDQDSKYNLAIDVVRNTGASQIRSKIENQWHITDPAQTTEPYNDFYPFLSKRKVVAFSQNVNINSVTQVTENFEFLVSKVDRLLAPRDPNHIAFREACKEVLGFEVSTVASESGKKIGFLIDTFNNISLEMMGDGVAHILGLISNLCVASNKIFLIEELENDLHPKALKYLLRMIIDKSDENQFFVSTHSNIVTKYLGSVPGAKLFKVDADFDGSIPNSTISEIPEKTVSRTEVLKDLGYEFHDFWVHNGWLILEESSAEVIIRDFLIPWFFPNLVQKLGTVSANGISKVEPSFEDYRRLFVFLHLEHAYKNKTWVWVDGDSPGVELVGNLKKRFGSTWGDDTFSHFERENFEDYYPDIFSSDVKLIKETKDKGAKKEKKRDLIEKVKKWSVEDKNAKALFEISAKEILDKLAEVEKMIS
jgi:predicted ATPase